MLALLGWMIVGLVAGLIARLLVPGRQPMGTLMTMGLGLLGSILGGVVSSLIFGTDPRDPGFHASGLLMSTVGATIVLALYVNYAGRHANR